MRRVLPAAAPGPPEVRGGGRPGRAARRPGRGQAVPPAHDRPAVAGGGQEPVKRQRHEAPPTASLKLETEKFLKSTWPGISPAVVNALDTNCSALTTAGVIWTGVRTSSLAALSMTLSGSPVALAHTAAQEDTCEPPHR